MAKLGFAAIPTHPGEVVKDELEARNISQKDFALKIGMSYTVLNEILNAHRPITTTTALLFEAALGLPADALLDIQTKYNLQTARSDKKIISWMSNVRNSVALW